MPDPTPIFEANKDVFPADLLDRAIVFATYAHAGMTRKDGSTPYISHPLEAMAIASSITDDREVLAAALLHDVIEDSGVSARELEELFSERVAEIVEGCSEDKREHLPGQDTWKIRKQETHEHLSRCLDREVLVVTLADKLSNMRSLARDHDALGDEIWKRFNQGDPAEHGWYYAGIAKALEPALGDTAAWKELDSLVRRVFGDNGDDLSR